MVSEGVEISKFPSGIQPCFDIFRVNWSPNSFFSLHQQSNQFPVGGYWFTFQTDLQCLRILLNVESSFLCLVGGISPYTTPSMWCEIRYKRVSVRGVVTLGVISKYNDFGHHFSLHKTTWRTTDYESCRSSTWVPVLNTNVESKCSHRHECAFAGFNWLVILYSVSTI